MLLRNSRQKRSNSATSKYKSIPLRDKDLNLIQTFRAEVKNRKNVVNQKKGKENKKVKLGENFPFEAIQFKNAATNSRQLMKEDFQEERLLSKYPNRNQQHFWKQAFHYDIKSSQQSRSNDNTWKKMPIQKQKEYCVMFKSAISKIFKGLDIFDRGVITETNINKWIPEQALYFLGNIFQRIREERLILTFESFLEQCRPVLEESTEEDLTQFLISVNGKDYKEAVSIDSSQGSEKQQKESKVELRITKDQRMENISKNIYKPLIPFDELQKPSEHKISRQQIIKTNVPISSKKVDFTSSSHKKLLENEKITEEIIPKEFNNQSKKKVDSGEPDLPYFNFKITEVPRTTNHVQRSLFDLTFKQTEMYLPKSSRIVHQKLSGPKDPPLNMINPITQRKQAAEPDRIDRLSSKLQEYIKFNKEKIERNKRFIRQNSLPKTSF